MALDKEQVFAQVREVLVDALGEYSDRLVSAETLCIRWLETRSKEELETYPMLVELTHAIVQEAFSSKIITPGVTTVDDVQWWMRQKMLDIGVEMWFPATVDRQGHGDKYDDDKTKIKNKFCCPEMGIL